jgi:hypothetical protein
MTAPTTLERKALETLARLEWENIAQLPAGAKTVAALFAKGWIEKVEDPFHDDRVRITATGRAALSESAPAKEPKRAKLTPLKPRLNTLQSPIRRPSR